MAEQKPQQSTLPGGQPLDASSVKPTPTQDENDRAAEGEHIEQHEPDGSPEEPQPEEQVRRTEKERHERQVTERRTQAPKPAGSSYDTRHQSAGETTRQPGGKPAA